MKISQAASFLLASVHFAKASNAGDVSLRGWDKDFPPERRLTTNCVGSVLQVNEELQPNEFLCTKINGEDVTFGIFTSPMAEPGYTSYRVELRSTNGSFSRRFSGLGTQGTPPTLKLQGDGHLVFGTQAFSGCIAMPGTTGLKLTIGDDGNGGLRLQIFDSEQEIVWRLGERECYPLVEDTCLSVLHKNERLSWKQYLCTYDQDGNVEYRFGLDYDVGRFGLWKGSSLIWRPNVGAWARGDYLHFQDDGHLTLYRDTTPKTFVWTSDDCTDFTAEKLVLTSDGDVQELNNAGAIVWTLQGSKAPPDASLDARDTVPEVCMPLPTCIVPPTTPLFVIKENVDIGDTMIRPGMAFARSCGPRCYDVRDNGDDPPYDPENGDTLRFAYKEVSSTQFKFRSKVCGTKCDDVPWTYESATLGRAGLVVRESLDPMAANLFVSHEPYNQAVWTYRQAQGDDSSYDFDGSPDVECLWITLERLSRNVFHFEFNYEGANECTIDDFDVLEATITFPNMPETVLLGLGVASGIPEYYCNFSEARFSHIQLDEQ